MPELSLSITFGLFFILLALLMAVLLAFLAYRVTVPPISQSRRMVLMMLRAISLFLIFLLLGEPFLSFIHRAEEPPAIVLLLDNSQSMTVVDTEGARSARLRSILEMPAFGQLGTIGTLRYALFDSRTRFLESFAADSLTFTGETTDLSAALADVKRAAASSNIQAVVLLSDGNSTSQNSPLFESDELRIPLFTIAVGDTTEQRDVLIRKVLTNNITYAGTRVPVNVTVKSSGYSGTRAEVTLSNEKEVIDRKVLQLQEGSRDYPVTLHFIPEHEGVQKYRVEVSHAPDEITGQNNQSVFFTKVLKSKIRVLLLAGSPSADLAFVRRSLEQDKDISVDVYTERKDGSFYDGPLSRPILEQADCVLLLGLPGPSTLTPTLHLLSDVLNGGKPLFFVPSRTLDLQKLGILEASLPFLVESVSNREAQAFVHVPPAAYGSSILKPRPGQAGDAWSLLPPFFVLDADIRAKPESNVLAFMRIQNATTGYPMIITRALNRRKSVALLGYGVWRWKMLGDNATGELFDEFLGNSVRWLTTREDDRTIRVSPIKEVFTSQEPVEFTGQVYDDSFQPVDDARITIHLTGSAETEELSMSPVGNGQYEARIDALPKGDYTFVADVETQAKTTQTRGSFNIGETSAEFQETRANSLLLQQLASRTGGTYYHPGTIADLPGDIRARANVRTREIVRASKYELWNLQWSLILLLALFSLEWFIRKRSGML